METIDFAVDIFCTIIECVVYVTILNIYWKYSSKHWLIVSAAMTGAFFCCGLFLENYTVIQIICCTALMMIYSIFVLKAEFWHALAISMILIVNTILVALFSLLLLEIVRWQEGSEMLMNTPAQKILYPMLNRILFVIVFYVWGRILTKRRMIKREEWILFAVYFIADSMIAMVLMLWAGSHWISGRDYLYILALELPVLIMTIVPLIIANQINKKNEYEKINEMANLKIQAQRADIIRMDKEYQDIRKIRHDMVKHLNIYMRLLNDGQYEELKKIIGEHIEDCGQNKYVFIRGNNLVNSVINEKKEICGRENIAFEITVNAAVDEKQELDVAVMLSNLLDNAIEAQRKMKNKEQCRICLTIFPHEGKYCILIKNTVAQSVLQNNPQLQTDKSNHSLHGIGMKSIEQTVQNKEGYIQKYEEDGMFCIHIML